MHSREIKSLIYQKAEKAVRGTMVRSVTHQILTYWWFFTFFVAVFSQILRWMLPRSTWTLATTTSTDLPCHLGFGRQEIRIAASIHIFCLVYFIGGPVFRQRPLKNHPFWGRITSLMCASVMHQKVNLVFFVSRCFFVPCDNIYAIGSDPELGSNTILRQLVLCLLTIVNCHHSHHHHHHPHHHHHNHQHHHHHHHMYSSSSSPDL